MKALAQMSHNEQATKESLASFKTALKKSKSKGDNYVIYQGEIWRPSQVEGIIAILEKKMKEYDTLRGTEPVDSK